MQILLRFVTSVEIIRKIFNLKPFQKYVQKSVSAAVIIARATSAAFLLPIILAPKSIAPDISKTVATPSDLIVHLSLTADFISEI